MIVADGSHAAKSNYLKVTSGSAQVDLSKLTLSVTSSSVLAGDGLVQMLVDSTAGGIVSGLFLDAAGNPIPDGAIVTIGGSGGSAVINYHFGTDGNDVALVTGFDIATTTVIASGQNASTYGDLVTFTVSLSGRTVPSSGDVEFYMDSVLIATVASAGGVATVTTSATQMTVGTHQVQAFYKGSTAYLSSHSGELSQTVTKKVLTGSITASNKVYDATPSATIATRSLDGAGLPRCYFSRSASILCVET